MSFLETEKVTITGISSGNGIKITIGKMSSGFLNFDTISL